jgi:hypothetical protein
MVLNLFAVRITLTRTNAGGGAVLPCTSAPVDHR